MSKKKMVEQSLVAKKIAQNCVQYGIKIHAISCCWKFARITRMFRQQHQSQVESIIRHCISRERYDILSRIIPKVALSPSRSRSHHIILVHGFCVRLLLTARKYYVCPVIYRCCVSERASECVCVSLTWSMHVLYRVIYSWILFKSRGSLATSVLLKCSFLLISLSLALSVAKNYFDMSLNNINAGKIFTQRWIHTHTRANG